MIKDVIKIESGEWAAEICPRLGANVVNLKYNGSDVLAPLNDEAQLEKSLYLQGAPILMPANRTYKGRFTFEGKEYVLPINEPHNDCNLHGSVLKQAFDVVETAVDSVTLRLLDTEAKSYPFPFELTVVYSVSENGFLSEFTVKNVGEGNMPLTFCTHTNFVEPESFRVPLRLCQEKDAHHIPTGRYVPLDAQQQGYVSGSPSRSLYITGYFLSDGTRAEVGDYYYDVSDNYDHWIFYNGGGGRGFLCVEPQAGKVDGLNNGGYILVKKGESVKFSTRISRK